MKYCFRACMLLLLVVTSYGVNGQYITLKGKQFYDQSGEPFYPVICNYEMRFVCNNCNCGIGGFGGSNCDSADYELHPLCTYGSDGNYEHPFRNGMDKVRADFIKMKQMGFNTVRIMGLFFSESAHTQLDSSGNEIPGEPGARIICHQYNNPYPDHPIMVGALVCSGYAFCCQPKPATDLPS